MPIARLSFWTLTLFGIALFAYTVLSRTPELPWVLLFLGAYVAFCTLGVLVPQLEMYGDVVWRRPSGAQRVALTFDDGPHPETTRRILEILAATAHRATFFVVGEKVEKYPDVVREVLQGRPCSSGSSFYRLRSAGLMSGDSARDVKLRCQLYATYLERHLL